MNGRFPVGTCRLERLDLIEFSQRKAYIIKPLQQSPGSVVVNSERQHRRSSDDVPILKIDSDFHTGTLLNELPEKFNVVLRDFGRQEARFPGIAPENIAEPRRDDHSESVVHQCPHRMLARRPRTEIGSGHQNGAAVKRAQVQHE